MRLVFIILLLMGISSDVLSDEIYPSIKIDFKEKVEVRAKHVKVSDLVTLSLNHESLKKRLLNTVIVSAPRPMHFMNITQRELTVYLEKFFPGITEHLRWGEQQSLRLSRVGKTITPKTGFELAEKTLISYLKEKFQTSSAAISVSRVDKDEELVIPDGKVSYQVRMPEGKYSERMPVWIDVLLDGKIYQTVVSWFSVAVDMPVFVANRNIHKHTKISTADWSLARKNIVALSSPPLSDESEFSHDVRTTTFLSEGTVLTKANVEVLPLVIKGELITVMSTYGSATVYVKGKALADGRLNETIMVESPSSGDNYQAIVSGKQLAQAL